jgi:hypothetical protein
MIAKFLDALKEDGRVLRMSTRFVCNGERGSHFGSHKTATGKAAIFSIQGRFWDLTLSWLDNALTKFDSALSSHSGSWFRLKASCTHLSIGLIGRKVTTSKVKRTIGSFAINEGR